MKWSAQCEPASKSILIDGSVQELDCSQLVGRKFLRNRVEIELSQCICMLCAVYFACAGYIDTMVQRDEFR